jgi:hypothetical protein
MTMRLHVDFNENMLVRPGVETIIIHIDEDNSGIRPEDLSVGQRVFLFSSDLECEAVLHRHTEYGWVADIIPGSYRDL